MSSKIEQLPIEVLLIIFEYLEAHDLVNAFGSLNSYFRSILASPQLRVHANIETNDVHQQISSNSIWSVLTLQSISSLKTQDKAYKTLVQFVQCHAHRLIHLTSLTLRIEEDHFEHIIRALPLLIDLKYLSIRQISRSNDENNKLSLLSAILSMRSLRICIMDEFFPKNAEKNFTRSSSIKKLRMKSTVSTSFIFLILPYMPNLRVFELDCLTWSDFCSFSHDSFVHNQLAVIKIDRWVTYYATLERLVHAAPSLRCLRISYLGMGTDEEQDKLFNPNLSKRLLEHIADVQIYIHFYVHEDQRTEEIRRRLQICSWLTLKTSFYNYLDAETVFEIVFKQPQ